MVLARVQTCVRFSQSLLPAPGCVCSIIHRLRSSPSQLWGPKLTRAWRQWASPGEGCRTGSKPAHKGSPLLGKSLRKKRLHANCGVEEVSQKKEAPHQMLKDDELLVSLAKEAYGTSWRQNGFCAVRGNHPGCRADCMWI